jgi:hypothetical protein
VTDPFAIFPRQPDGSLRSGLYHRIPIHKIWDALAMGWIPVPPTWHGAHEDRYIVWATWIECACGRPMAVPR